MELITGTPRVEVLIALAITINSIIIQKSGINMLILIRKC